jgi:transposase-like protein
MARKRCKPEEIVAKLRQVDVLVSQGQNMVDAIRQIGVSEVTYYRWRQEFVAATPPRMCHHQPGNKPPRIERGSSTALASHHPDANAARISVLT